MSGIPIIKLSRSFDHIEKSRMAAITIWDIIKNNVSRRDIIFSIWYQFFLMNIHVRHPMHATSIYFLLTASTFFMQRVLTLCNGYLVYTTSTYTYSESLLHTTSTSTYNKYWYIKQVITQYNEYLLFTKSTYLQWVLFHKKSTSTLLKRVLTLCNEYLLYTTSTFTYNNYFYIQRVLTLCNEY